MEFPPICDEGSSLVVQNPAIVDFAEEQKERLEWAKDSITRIVQCKCSILVI